MVSLAVLQPPHSKTSAYINGSKSCLGQLSGLLTLRAIWSSIVAIWHPRLILALSNICVRPSSTSTLWLSSAASIAATGKRSRAGYASSSQTIFTQPSKCARADWVYSSCRTAEVNWQIYIWEHGIVTPYPNGCSSLLPMTLAPVSLFSPTTMSTTRRPHHRIADRCHVLYPCSLLLNETQATAFVATPTTSSKRMYHSWTRFAEAANDEI